MRRRRQSGDTRQRLITAARVAFSEREFDEVTVEDILAAADVSRATFYGYFSSREDIFLAVWKEMLFELRQEMRLRVADGHQRPHQTNLDEIRRIVVDRIAITIASWRKEAKLKRAYLAFELLHPELARSVWEERAASMNAASAWVRRDAEAGMLNDIDPGMAIMALGLLLEWFGFHLVVMGLPEVGSLTDRQFAEQLATIWIDGVYRANGLAERGTLESVSPALHLPSD